MHTRIFSFILILASYATSYAQEPIYKHFGVDEGLPSSEVYDIYQDKNGYIWFATDKGLSRYNGYEFENFDINDGLPGNVVLRFYPQVNGEVWCYSLHHKALFYFNENFDGFRTYKHNSILNKALGKRSIVKSIFIDKFNTIHFGGVHINGELLIDKKGKVSKKYFFEGHSSKKSIVLKNDSKGDVGFYFRTIDKNIINKNFSNKSTEISHIHALWLVRNKKAVFMDGNSIAIIIRNKSIKTIKSQFMTLGVKAIDSTRFFAGYYYGGSKIINDKGETIQEYLKGKSVTNFLIDHEGGYWFTTLNSGVYYIKNPSIAVFKQPENSISFHINSLVKKKNELLIGYKNGDFAKIGANRVFKLKIEASITTPSLVEYDSISDKT
ncbi:MAG: hypothetical protein HRT69_15495, partial [Flavobacteriaceae bacterium]|nr:hypothetical protein [Flavobacteriaceae bacterium]